ncbi:MAG: hypothetical protein PeribacterA2_0209 [Candidatus Peribacter riflensis]|uniref:Uncharacterized protein n=1 Tax=Candidatus Peribacter riflensis TaxID=1735162 RepID=A0A0S1SJ24_9BACT|nr:MAG: hypothetical protein PeribacterA2_0209 [Candidatus Peribacter riflensis]ALM10705.1 MAG: hypothetical protein PeribacterB2_0209 [Candidatus Peribacter riflensis]ALM11807.1 MAG: hypothetical protein PeribacterC2_0208 [Candidatus Peribacter riflensis]ALM12910.1 MAG: hypothetical protein PeribacterD1_0209 [Candidatus Peribacter riflensis]ALM14011.1 MAG: hypothetical protein PeribacterD2_0209 [Candidatus Peribacter riflensis]
MCNWRNCYQIDQKQTIYRWFYCRTTSLQSIDYF